MIVTVDRNIVYRKMLKISWVDHVANDHILQRVEQERNIMNSLIVVWLQICPFSIDIFMDIAQWKSRVLFLIP